MPGAEVQGPREGSWLCPDLWAHPSQTTTLVEASISSHVEEAALGKLQGPSFQLDSVLPEFRGNSRAFEGL